MKDDLWARTITEKDSLYLLILQRSQPYGFCFCNFLVVKEFFWGVEFYRDLTNLVRYEV